MCWKHTLSTNGVLHFTISISLVNTFALDFLPLISVFAPLLEPGKRTLEVVESEELSMV